MSQREIDYKEAFIKRGRLVNEYAQELEDANLEIERLLKVVHQYQQGVLPEPRVDLVLQNADLKTTLSTIYSIIGDTLK